MYKVYFSRLRKTSELVDRNNPDSPHFYAVELVYVAVAGSMAEAKLLTVTPILEMI